LTTILQDVPIDASNQGLLYVLLYEFLLGPNKSIRGGGKLKRNIVNKQKELEKALSRVSTNRDQNDAVNNFPRYVRVNTCHASTKQISELLKNQADIDQLYLDPHVPDLLVLPKKSSSAILKLQTNGVLGKGDIVLQDKVSCFPALCLVHGFGTSLPKGDYLDACAAPGNKTSHLAALLREENHKGTLHAFDRDPDRHTILQKRLSEFIPNKDCSKVETMEQDFLAVKPSDFSNVVGVLLDPTCSGSGIYTSHHPSATEERIKSLSGFQLKALRHAASFPAVQRIVYSTCSVNKEENELVVAEFLSKEQEWSVVEPICLKHWKRRGQYPLQVDDADAPSLTEQQASCLIRATHEDETSGFFVCCLQKGKQTDEKSSKNWKAKIKSMAKACKLSLYDGQFATSRQKTETESFSNIPRPSNQSSAEKPTSKEPLSEPRSEPEPAIPNKKRKKLEWKRKQKQQMIERRKKKKAKTSLPVSS